MLVGKCPLSPIMKRTKSMSGGMAAETQTQTQTQTRTQTQTTNLEAHSLPHEPYEQRLGSLSPTTTTTTTTIHTPHFLRTCGLCKSRLAPARDIYMYRGDTAFCSLECREKQIKQDHTKEKWKLSSNKEDHRRPSPSTATANSSTKTETAACI